MWSLSTERRSHQRRREVSREDVNRGPSDSLWWFPQGLILQVPLNKWLNTHGPSSISPMRLFPPKISVLFLSCLKPTHGVGTIRLRLRSPPLKFHVLLKMSPSSQQWLPFAGQLCVTLCWMCYWLMPPAIITAYDRGVHSSDLQIRRVRKDSQRWTDSHLLSCTVSLLLAFSSMLPDLLVSMNLM